MLGSTFSGSVTAPAIRGSSSSKVEPRGGRRAHVRGDESSLAVRCTAAAIALAIAAVPCVASAFSEPLSYFDDSALGGGGGRWFTGSPAEGYGCSVCHSGGTAKLQVTGLHTGGYAPGFVYDVTLAWPEFAARYNALNAAPLPGAEPPSMGLVAELVSDSGLGAGHVEVLDPSVSSPLDLCQPLPGTTERARAAQLYSVRPGEPTEPKELSCDAGALGQRCLIAVPACGAEQLHVRWTPPATPVGPIWFAAGFVTTDAISGTPQGDSVKEYARALLPASSSAVRYESEIDGGCSVRAPRANDVQASRWGAFLLVAALFALGRTRRREARSAGARKGRA
jgi:hypothetical protein